MKVQKLSFKKKNLGILSPLESDVLNILWKHDYNFANGSVPGLRVKQIHHKLNKNDIALTSVAVILDRLYQKEIVSRKMETGRGGVHYIYSSRVTREAFQKNIIDKTVQGLIDNFGHVAVSYFNEKFTKEKGSKK